MQNNLDLYNYSLCNFVVGDKLITPHRLYLCTKIINMALTSTFKIYFCKESKNNFCFLPLPMYSIYLIHYEIH
jgi:hypothetical protein